MAWYDYSMNENLNWGCCPTCPTPVVVVNGETKEAVLTLDGCKEGAQHVCR